ncbi:MAG: GNAT family N-acetyltransferase [Chloroflexota bacterium]|nr:GNAT family N-acetyltransferase [Chloroflexota bacterium]
MITELSHPAYRRDLGGGLVLHWSTAADVQRIGELYAFVFRDKAEDPPNQYTPAWTQDLMSGQHPLIGAGDFALVENSDGPSTSSGVAGAIVAATCLMRQTWEYDQIAFPVGRPEIVATMPDFRNRGLIRSIFELIHARSAAEGHLAQGITGIAYYYRQFGYEYALDLDGRRSVYLAATPKLKPGDSEPYTLRAATSKDLPQALALYDRERARGPISAQTDADYWRWVLEGQNPAAGEGWGIWMIVGAAGDRAPVGYLLTNRRLRNDRLSVVGLALEPGVALPTLLPSLLRALQGLALAMPPSLPDRTPVARIVFALYASHPIYDALGAGLTADVEPPYAWYVRVPDLPQFIRRIAPALERRLAGSSASGYTGELTLNFFRSGLRLVFEQGRLTDAADFRAEGWDPHYNAGFPPLVFLQLLFGRRSLAELRHIFPDIYADQIGRSLLEALFPARPSWVLPLE